MMKTNKFLLMLLAGLYASSSFANVIVDTKGVDMDKYDADMYECQQISHQVQSTHVDSAGRVVVGSTARAAALGAAGTAIAGGHGSKGAQVGAGVGLVTGLLHHRAEVNYSEQKYSTDVDQVMNKCMVGRGYEVLN